MSNIGRLQASRLVRAVGQGALVVTFSLYLKELGWSAVSIGLLFTAGGLVSSITGWLIGMASDRVGRKAFVLAYDWGAFAFGAMLLLTHHRGALAAAGVLFGFGSTQTGIPGFASAAEQAWLAEEIEPGQRGVLFSQNAALGFFGMALGAVSVAAMPLLSAAMPGILRYRPFFALVALGALINAWLIQAIDPNASPPETSPVEGEPGGAPLHEEALKRREENAIMVKMAVINAFNGVAVGLTSPLLAYWFNLRFGVGPDSIAPVFALTFVMTGLASIWTGWLSERVGIVRAVVSVRLGAVILLLILPLMPTFASASVVHVIRTALGRGSLGARRALAVNLIRSHRRGLASSINNMSMELPVAIGPSIAGLFLGLGELTLPFFLAAGMQFLYGTLYGAAFSRADPGPSISRRDAKGA